MAQYKVVVIGHGYTSRLAVIRSVAQIGCEVTVVVMTGRNRLTNRLKTKKPIDCYSKYVNRYLFCCSNGEEELINLLLTQCVDEQQKVVIIPDSDFSSAAIDNNQNRLKDYFLFPHIHHTQGAVVEWMNKVKQKTLARELGLNVASSCVISIVNGHYEVPFNISYPCFTKPMITIIGGKRLMKRCDNKSDLCSVLDSVASFGNMQVLIEDFKKIDVEYAVVGFSNGQEVIIPGVLQILEMSHGGHYGVARRGIVMSITGFEDLISKFNTFLKRIGYVGLFDIDFYQSDGRYYFGELNLRFGGSGYAVTKMGVNLPGMFVRSLCGESFVDMQRLITGTAIYVNERMCFDDWVSGDVSTSDFKKHQSTADISFVNDEDDPKPYMIYDKNSKSIFTLLKRIKEHIQKR